MDIFARVVDEAQAVVVSFFLDGGDLGAVAFNDVEKSLNACIDSCVRRM